VRNGKQRSPEKQRRVEQRILERSNCGNGIASTKGFPRPTGKKFVRHQARDPKPGSSIRELADAMYREDHGT
jgi:hypothetical protein